MNHKFAMSAVFLALFALLGWALPDQAAAKGDSKSEPTTHENRSGTEQDAVPGAMDSTMDMRGSTMSPSAASHVTVEQLRAKSGKTFDKAFIEEMIRHHEEAITMAELAKKKAKNKELKEMAENMITHQRDEINFLRRLQSGEKTTGRVTTHESEMMEE